MATTSTTPGSSIDLRDTTTEAPIDVAVVAKALTPPAPTDAEAAAEPTAEQMHSDDSDLGLVVREVMVNILLWMGIFLVLAGIGRLVMPGLADLDAGGTLVFLLLSSGFGIIPGMVVGVGKADHRLGLD